MTWPGPPEARTGLRTGDLLRAVSCHWPEGVLLGYANPALAVCVLGPGSAGPVPARRCITFLERLAGALAAPGAVACFARGVSRFPAPEANGHAPAWLQMLSCQPHGLTPTHGLPWVPAQATAGHAAAAFQITAAALPLRKLVVTSLSSPECLPLLLSHPGAACTSHDRSDATVSVPAAAGSRHLVRFRLTFDLEISSELGGIDLV